MAYACGMKEQEVRIQQTGYIAKEPGVQNNKLTSQPESSYANLRRGVLFMGEPGNGEGNSKGPTATIDSPQPRGRSRFRRTIRAQDKKGETPALDQTSRRPAANPEDKASDNRVNGLVPENNINTLQPETVTKQKTDSEYLEMLQALRDTNSIENPYIKEKLITFFRESNDPYKVWKDRELQQAVITWQALKPFVATDSQAGLVLNVVEKATEVAFTLAERQGKGMELLEAVNPVLSAINEQIDGDKGMIGRDRPILREEAANITKVLNKSGYGNLGSEVMSLVTGPASPTALLRETQTENSGTQVEKLIERISDPALRAETQDFFRLLGNPDKKWTDGELQKAYITWNLKPLMATNLPDKEVLGRVAETARDALGALAADKKGEMISLARLDTQEIMDEAGIGWPDFETSSLMTPEARTRLAGLITKAGRGIRGFFRRPDAPQGIRENGTDGTDGNNGNGGGEGNGGDEGTGGTENADGGGRGEREDPYHVPLSIEELVVEIAASDETKWGRNGTHPIYEVVGRAEVTRSEYVRDPDTNEIILNAFGQPITESRRQFLPPGEIPRVTDIVWEENVRVNTDNFVRWARSWMMYYHFDSPDSPYEFEKILGLKTRPGKFNSTIPLSEMLHKREQFFRTRLNVPERGGKLQYDGLVEELKKEIYGFQELLSERIQYENNIMLNERALPEAYMKLKVGNPITKKVWGDTSILAWVMSTAENYIDEGNVVGAKPENNVIQDGRVGQAIASGLKFYRHLGDYRKLITLFEKGFNGNNHDPDDANFDAEWATHRFTSKLFTWDGLQKAVKMQLEATEEKTINNSREKYFTDALALKIFGKKMDELTANSYVGEGFSNEKDKKTGKSPKEEAWDEYIKYINFYAQSEVDPKNKEITRNLLRYEIGERYDMKVATKEDPDKKLEPELDMDLIKFVEVHAYSLPRPMFIGAENDTGRQAADAATKTVHTMFYRIRSIGNIYPKSKLRARSAGNQFSLFVVKSLLPEFMVAARTVTPKTINDEGKVTAYKTMEDVIEELHYASNARVDTYARDERIRLANELTFPENTERNYAKNVVEQGSGLYAWINQATGIDWAKVTDRHTFSKGVTLKRAEFQAEVLDKFMKPWSTMFTTWNQTSLKQHVRAEVFKLDNHGNPTGETEYKTIPQGQKMFGFEVFDVPDFHKKRKDWPDGARKRGWDTIDWDYVDTVEGRDKLWTNVVTVLLTAEIVRAKDIMSHDQAYDDHYWLHMYKALQTIPTSVSGNEMNMRHVQLMGKMFDRERINRMKQKSGTQAWRVAGLDLLKWGAEPGFYWAIVKQMFSGLL